MLMCGVGTKSVAHLMKFHLLQWEVVKVKFLMNSIYLGFYVAFNTVQVISRREVGRAEETST